METSEGHRNDRLAEGLALWAQRKDHQTFSEVLRRAVMGELLLDITDSTFADPEVGFQPGDRIAITSQRDNAGKNLLVAFTAQEHLNRFRGRPGIALVQPAAATLAQALRDYEGIVIDGRSEGSFIAYTEELGRYLAGEPEAAGRLSELTAFRSMPPEEYIAVLAQANVYIPYDIEHDESGGQSGVSVPSATAPEGGSYAVMGSSPAEIWAWSPGSNAQRTTLAQVVRVARREGQAGVVVNPAGPLISLPIDWLNAIE